MTLTKAKIGEAVAEQIGYTKTQSVEMLKPSWNILKDSWNPVRMSLSVASGSFVSRQSMNAGEEILQPERT